MSSPRAGSPPGPRSGQTQSSAMARDIQGPDEETPLLVREEGDETETHDGEQSRTAVSSLLASIRGLRLRTSSKTGAPPRWPSILALFFLCLVVVVILVAGFFTPEIVKDYAQQATVFEPSSISIHSFTTTGVVARIQGDFVLDASRVRKQSTRNFGRFATWIARGVETKASDVIVTLPQYDDLVLGTAQLPAIAVSIVNGHHNEIDVLSELTPGPVDGIRRVANDFIDGSLGDVLVAASAEIGLRSGILSIGTHAISHMVNFPAGDVPTLPKYDIERLSVHEVDVPNVGHGLSAEAAVGVQNKYPIDLTIPPLGFNILADGCSSTDPYIMLADATTEQVHVKPKHKVHVNVTGFLQSFPDEFLSRCPNSQKSPFDVFVDHYIQGKPTKFYVKGSNAPDTKTPEWISQLTSGIVVPISVPNKAPDNLMKNFSLSDTHFSLPDIFAEPDTPESLPSISTNIKASVSLPDEVNFDVAVNQFRANATIFYKGSELGILDMTKWRRAMSRPVSDPHSPHKELEVSTHVEKAPVTITSEEVFQNAVQALLFGDGTVRMLVKATVAVGMETPLGTFIVQNIPAEGEVPVQPISGGGNGDGDGPGRDLDSLGFRVGNLTIDETTPYSLSFSAAMNFSNPTKYTASVPFIDLNILTNGTVIGHAFMNDLEIVAGNNTDIFAKAIWQPSAVDGNAGVAAGQELLSRYVSGYNTSLTVKMHANSIPAQPVLGRALQDLAFDVPMGHLMPPTKPGDNKDGPHFISDATMHIFSSTATFTLHSPFAHTTMHIVDVNATAFHDGDIVGKILYNEDISVPPGDTETPSLPVDWSWGSTGWSAIRDALGGHLYLGTEDTSRVRIGLYEERLWFRGKGIGVKIRL